jgi:hypothetical protein
MNMSTHQYNWPSCDLRNIKTDVDWLYKCCFPCTQLIQKLVNMRCSRFDLRILFRLHVTIFNANTFLLEAESAPQHHSSAGGIRQLDNLFFLSFFLSFPISLPFLIPSPPSHLLQFSRCLSYLFLCISTYFILLSVFCLILLSPRYFGPRNGIRKVKMIQMGYWLLVSFHYKIIFNNYYFIACSTYEVHKKYLSLQHFSRTLWWKETTN